MSKLLNLKAALALLSAFAMAAGAANAQSTANGLFKAGAVKEKFSVSDVASIMAEFQITTTLSPYAGNGAAAVLAETSGGARFVVTLFECDDPAAGVGCAASVVFTGAPNAGIAYDDINAFNASANVTRAVNVAEQNIIIFGRQLFFAGGVTRAYYKNTVEYFLIDMQGFIQSQAAAGTAVSLKSLPGAKGKTDNVAGGSDSVEVIARAISRVEANDHALSAAIANTWQVRFTNDDK